MLKGMSSVKYQLEKHELICSNFSTKVEKLVEIHK